MSRPMNSSGYPIETWITDGGFEILR